jgi:hypothetical protein
VEEYKAQKRCHSQNDTLGRFEMVLDCPVPIILAAAGIALFVIENDAQPATLTEVRTEESPDGMVQRQRPDRSCTSSPEFSMLPSL